MRSTQLRAVEELPGVTSFPGFFDPAGISKGQTPAIIKYFREAELKHGRVAMLASLGFLVGASYLLREDLTLDFGAFYEFMLDPTEDTIELQPFPNSPPLDGVSTFDGELVESGLYLSVGLSFVF